MKLARFIAAGFGTGYAPFAAGTAASAAAVASGAALMVLSPWALVLAAFLATFGGYLAVKQAAVEGDPGWVVIDEFAGQWITLLALPRPTLTGLLAAFILFRFFDITKFGPVGWADRRHGAFGIMADDVIAGTVAAALLILLRLYGRIRYYDSTVTELAGENQNKSILSILTLAILSNRSVISRKSPETPQCPWSMR